MIYYLLTCPDPRRDGWEYSMLIEPNKDDTTTDRRNVGERLMNMGDGMYTFAF